MTTRAFQLGDTVTSPALGRIDVDIYNDEEQIKREGYCKSGHHDQYGYDIWHYNATEDRPYYQSEYAILLPIPFTGRE